MLRRVEVCLNLCKADSQIMELCLIDGLYLMITQLCSVEHCVTLASANSSVLLVACFAYGEMLFKYWKSCLLLFLVLEPAVKAAK